MEQPIVRPPIRCVASEVKTTCHRPLERSGKVDPTATMLAQTIGRKWVYQVSAGTLGTKDNPVCAKTAPPRACTAGARNTIVIIFRWQMLIRLAALVSAYKGLMQLKTLSFFR